MAVSCQTLAEKNQTTFMINLSGIQITNLI